MKTRDQIAEEVRALTHEYYYREDYELEWAAKAYVDSLAEEEKHEFDAIMTERLTASPGLDDVALCARTGRMALSSYLVAQLEKEKTTSSVSRALLSVLTRQPAQEAFVAVERFLDSDQEGEALECLARIDFERALPYLRRAVQQDHLHNHCLHAMHMYMQEKGMDALVIALRTLMDPEPARLSAHVRKIIYSKQGDFNPFSEQDLLALTKDLI